VRSKESKDGSQIFAILCGYIFYGKPLKKGILITSVAIVYLA